MTPPHSRWMRSTEWLADHLAAPDLVVVDGSFYLPAMQRDARAEYDAGHIPGAVFFDIDAIADTTSPLPHMLPRPEAFASSMRKLGIGDGQTIVVYDGAGLFSAPRVWWTFRVFGVERVFVLEGGMPKWRAEGRAVDSAAARREPRHFTARMDHGQVADLGDVKRALESGSAQVIDARTAARFRGEEPEPRPGLRSGHMPGSISVPWETLVENGTLVARERIERIFKDSGMDASKPVITTCGSGVSAAILWLALDAVGKPPRALYDGSWAEWGGRADLPIAAGAD